MSKATMTREKVSLTQALGTHAAVHIACSLAFDMQQMPVPKTCSIYLTRRRILFSMLSGNRILESIVELRIFSRERGYAGCSFSICIYSNLYLTSIRMHANATKEVTENYMEFQRCVTFSRMCSCYLGRSAPQCGKRTLELDDNDYANDEKCHFIRMSLIWEQNKQKKKLSIFIRRSLLVRLPMSPHLRYFVHTDTMSIACSSCEIAQQQCRRWSEMTLE